MGRVRNQSSEPSARGEVATSDRFAGTDNPRHLRIIAAALRRSLPRKHVDQEAGCSNGPELIAELRRRGLAFPCVRIDATDRDGRPCKPGVYTLTDKDRRLLNRWLSNRGRSNG